MKIKRFCIVCEKQLASAGSNHGDLEMEITDPPSHGIHMTSHGNWGSTAFDCPGGYIEMTLCDECLKEKAKKGFIHYIRIETPDKKFHVKTFEPEKDWDEPYMSPKERSDLLKCLMDENGNVRDIEWDDENG